MDEKWGQVLHRALDCKIKDLTPVMREVWSCNVLQLAKKSRPDPGGLIVWNI